MNDHAITPSQSSPLEIDATLHGQDILENALLNKSTAFTMDERDVFGLHGLLPANVENLQEQVARRLACVRNLATDLDRYVYLRDLQDANETLYYALITQNLEELLPMIYTPTVGLGCQQFSHIYHRPRGLFLSYPQRDRLDQIFANPRFDKIECIVVTDGERILGLGDQGAGGMGIPIGKLAIYSAAGGIDPATTLPITLDLGTNNADRLDDPMYIGWRHERVRGKDYDDFIDAFVRAVARRWPNVLLQWEDFHKNNAYRLLNRYCEQLCSFNDDIQGTASVATGTLLSAIHVTGVPLSGQRIGIVGGGSAGIGIADLIRQAMVEEGLTDEAARARFFVVGREGLITDRTTGLDEAQKPFAQKSSALADWVLHKAGRVGLLDVVRNARLTVLVGVSGQHGIFTEDVIREMAKHVQRPIIFPLSNPTSCVEADPSDIIRWTEGRALVGAGSPFKPFEHEGRTHRFAQCNNSYIFPGLGLAVLAVKARRVTNTMLLAAAKALAELSPARTSPDVGLLPPLSSMREVSCHIAVAVAKQARAEGLCDAYGDAQIEAKIRSRMWEPQYRPYLRRKS